MKTKPDTMTLSVDSAGAVIICAHVAKMARPVLRGRRDLPVSAEDSGWQFRCGESDDDPDSACVWSVAELLEQDQSIACVIEEPFGTIAERDHLLEPWKVSRFDPGESD